MTATIRATAQQPDAIVKKYINDTTGFAAYPDAFLLENLNLPEKYKKLEINTWVSLYTPKKIKYQYRNLYRYPGSAQKSPDTAVLSKCDLLKCFTACWCPDFDPWYISAQTKDNKLLTVADTVAMKTFLGKIDNKFKAYLWLQLYHVRYGEVPVKTSHFFKFKKVKNGFLLIYRSMIETSPETDADLTYFVSNDFKILLISKRNEVVNKNLSFKI